MNSGKNKKQKYPYKYRIIYPGNYNFIGPVLNSELQSYYSNVRAYQGKN